MMLRTVKMYKDGQVLIVNEQGVENFRRLGYMTAAEKAETEEKAIRDATEKAKIDAEAKAVAAAEKVKKEAEEKATKDAKAAEKEKAKPEEGDMKPISKKDTKPKTQTGGVETQD